MNSQRNPQGTLKEEFSLSKLRLAQPNAAWLATSPFVSDAALMAVRLVITLFAVAVIITSGVRDGSTKWFIFLTNWQYLFMTLSFIGFSGLSIQRMVLRRAKSSTEGEWKWFHSLLQLLFSITVPVSVLVSILYWALLDAQLGFVSISVHALNVFLTVTELGLSNFKINVMHAVYTMAFSIIYLVFSVVYSAAGGTNAAGKTYIYRPLDWTNKPGAAAGLAVPVALVAAPGIHFLAYSVCKLRMHLQMKLAPEVEVDNSVSSQHAGPRCAEAVV